MDITDIPQELINLLNERAGRQHSAEGAVLTTLAEILSRWNPVEPLVARIEERKLHWNCHRTAMGQWYVEIRDSGDNRLEHLDDSLTAALTWALDAAFLPVVPRKPRVGLYEVRRSEDSTLRWHVYESGSFDRRFPTRKAAEAFVERATERSRATVVDWNQQWATLVETGTPDVDFRWAA